MGSRLRRATPTHPGQGTLGSCAFSVLVVVVVVVVVVVMGNGLGIVVGAAPAPDDAFPS